MGHGFNIKLVGGIPTPLKKYEFVSWGYYSKLIGKSQNSMVPVTTNQQTVRNDKKVKYGKIDPDDSQWTFITFIFSSILAVESAFFCSARRFASC